MRTIGYKIGGITFVVVALSVWLMAATWDGMAAADAALRAVVAGGVAYVAAYAAGRYLISRRLQSLRRMMVAISDKRFDQLSEIDVTGKDELDELIKESAKAAETIENEFQRMKRLEDYRKDFIGDISHELKTPIFAIQGFVETLLDGALEDESVNRHFLQKTMKNVSRLTILTNDLMEIAKLETGELKSHMQPIYIGDAVHEVQETLQYRADEDGIRLVAEIPDNKLRVLADRNQLRQVLVNLVENGIKYNHPKGQVIIKAYLASADGRKVCVAVKDTGIGIGKEYIDRVTERFFRVDKSRSRGKGGTGLGLSIVKHILESHGSALKVKSAVGEGSEFSFCLKNADSISA